MNTETDTITLEETGDFVGTGTYDPADNKLRLRPFHRLDPETYSRVKNAGFIWAPKQEFFVAPMWTPERADLLTRLCGEIGDEDTSLVERAEQRAERFGEYSENRLEDAGQARDYVASIADHIPLGQPILVGHHSERHARKDAERIESGMRKAVKMWECSKYWTQRAAGALRHAKYKESPAVRARRIKGLESDLRRWQGSYTIDPRQPAQMWDGVEMVWVKSGGRCGSWQRKASLPAREAYAKLWEAHIQNRLAYEKAMLGEQGATHLLEKPERPALLPICNYRAPSIRVENKWHRGEFLDYPQVEMTSAEYAKIHPDYKGCEPVEYSHRVRIARGGSMGKWVSVFLTDSKEHQKPEPGEKPQPPGPRLAPVSTWQPPARTEFDDLKDSLKAGVKTVSAPQLFPTPPAIAAQMIELAEIKPGHRVLEPSAGTGNLLRAMPADCESVAVEQNLSLSQRLVAHDEPWPHLQTTWIGKDFLACNVDLGKFDRVVMNPPFENGADIKHIRHAFTFLKPGGKLVALCAAGPRQTEALSQWADSWEVLPAGSFKSEGTGVNVAMLVKTA